MRTLLLALFTTLTLAWTSPCSAEPNAKEAAAFDYGEKPGEGYKDQITDYFNSTLKDPYSAHIDIGNPKKAWYQTPPLFGSRTYFGWLVKTKVNAKNSYGAYIGEQIYVFVFHGDKITHISDPDEVRFVHHLGYPPASTNP